MRSSEKTDTASSLSNGLDPKAESSADDGRTEGFRRSTSACARAIAGDASIDITFKQVGSNDDEPGGSILPEIPDGANARERMETRGRSDAIALHRQHHDARTHRRFEPASDSSRHLHALAEQARVELLGKRELAGVGANLDAALESRYRLLLDTVRAPVVSMDEIPEPRLSLPHALSLYLRERLGSGVLPPAASEALSEWREWLDTDVSDKLDCQAFDVENQASFARALGQLLMDLGIESGDSESPEPEPEDSSDPDEDESSSDQDESNSEENPSSEELPDENEPFEEEGDASEASEMLDPDDVPDDASEMPGSEWRTASGEARRPLDNDYHIYTREFDEVIQPLDLCEPLELLRLRKTLDQHVGDLQQSIGRFSNRLQRVLMAQQRRSWEFDLEEGQLDCSRLTRLLTDPLSPLTFKQEYETPFRDTVVTLLLDNSGSMHGRSIRVAAVCADILSSTLERCGVRIEVLGFTTCAWKGGQARERWVAAGYPQNPGRLNDLRHIVYKSADTPWRKARQNLGLMMRKGLLKENIDGEALQWAYSRLMHRTEQRKILMMISDGAPIDDSTLSTNPGRFLEKHLRNVIGQIEQQAAVELVAIGIGHDVRQYYARAATIHDVGQLPDVMTGQLVELFSA